MGALTHSVMSADVALEIDLEDGDQDEAPSESAQA